MRAPTERVVEHRGRSIEKVSLTFDDFGSFQDRSVLFQVFDSCLGSQFGAIDASLQPKLKNLNAKAQKLVEQIRELSVFDERLAKRPCFPFLVPQRTADSCTVRSCGFECIIQGAIVAYP